jgi:predicted dienelactone hydrolase
MQMIEDLELEDSSRDRRVLVRAYRWASEPRGWVLFSVGYGGQRSGYAYMAKAWAEQGFHVFVIEHVGSNLEVLKSFPQERLEERYLEVVRRVQLPSELKARPRDLELVYETFRNGYRRLPLGLAGHSYGSYTVFAGAGLEPLTVSHGVRSLPLSGLLAISPQPPGMLFGPAEFRKVKSPTLLLTGTQDDLLAGGATYRERLKVYDCLPPELRHLTVLDGVAHMTFAGVGLGIEKYLRSIAGLTSMWWNRILGRSVADNWPSQVRNSDLKVELAECL